MRPRLRGRSGEPSFAVALPDKHLDMHGRMIDRYHDPEGKAPIGLTQCQRALTFSSGIEAYIRSHDQQSEDYPRPLTAKLFRGCLLGRWISPLPQPSAPGAVAHPRLHRQDLSCTGLCRAGPSRGNRMAPSTAGSLSRPSFVLRSRVYSGVRAGARCSCCRYAFQSSRGLFGDPDFTLSARSGKELLI